MTPNSREWVQMSNRTDALSVQGAEKSGPLSCSYFICVTDLCSTGISLILEMGKLRLREMKSLTKIP